MVSTRKSPAEKSKSVVRNQAVGEFTPSPLRVRVDHNVGVYRVGTPNGIHTTANCYYEPGFTDLARTAKANATLYAAAPDLLEALHDAERAMSAWDWDTEEPGSPEQAALFKARAAIQKAQGAKS